ncbi:MAG: hypothetical protein AB1405_03320 [Bdellovibrionota bacterium]
MNARFSRAALGLLVLLGAPACDRKDESLEYLIRDQQTLVYEGLSLRGVRGAVLQEMGRFPRHQLLPPEQRQSGYQDVPLEAEDGTFIWAPSALGLALTALDPKSGERALVVGAQDGWAAGVLAGIGLDVIVFEPTGRSVETVERALQGAQYEPGGPAGSPFDPKKIHFARSEGEALSAGPFHRILVLGAVERVPQNWLEALSPKEGRFIAPVGVPGDMYLFKIDRSAEGFQQTGADRGEYSYLLPDRPVNYGPFLVKMFSPATLSPAK